MTIDPNEIAALDSGQIVGWERTGFRFLAYDSPGAGRNHVCRFYRKPAFQCHYIGYHGTTGLTEMD